MGTSCCKWSKVARVMCGVRLVDRVLTRVLQDGVGVVVKIEDMIMPSHLWCFGRVMHGEIKSQIWGVMEVEITGKRKKSRQRKLDLEWSGLRREDTYDKKNGESEVEETLLTPASWDNSIKMGVIVVAVVVVLSEINNWVIDFPWLNREKCFIIFFYLISSSILFLYFVWMCWKF